MNSIFSMTPIDRRRALMCLSGAAASLALPGLALPARAQPGAASAAAGSAPYPAHPITLVVPWPAGGATDLTMRILAEAAGKHLGQHVVVENRPGAAGTLAMPLLQQAPPDGYLIAQLPITVFRAPHVRKVLWDPVRDITPIIRISGVTFGMVVPANSPFRSVDDVLRFARSNPGALTVGTNGVGTTPHVVMDELFAKLGAKWIHVPYKGTAEQMLAVAAGSPMVGINSNGFAPFVEEGKLRLLALFSAERSARWPQVPTMKELGYGIVATSPYGLGGPHGLPPAIVRRLHDAFRLAMNEPAHLAELAKYDQVLSYQGTEEYTRYTHEAYEAERHVVERLGLKTGG